MAFSVDEFIQFVLKETPFRVSLRAVNLPYLQWQAHYVVHHVEGRGARKPQFWTVDDSGDKLVLGQRIEPEQI